MTLRTRVIVFFCLTATALPLGACSSDPGLIFLAPTPEARVSDIGGRQKVLVEVRDMREAPALGQKTSASGQIQEIRSLQEVEDVLRTQIERGLTARDFVPVSRMEGATRRLDVRLEQFSYNTESSVVSSKVIVTTAMTVVADVNGRPYTHSYTSKSEETVALSPTEETRERAVNAALTELLNKFMRDDALFEALAGE